MLIGNSGHGGKNGDITSLALVAALLRIIRFSWSLKKQILIRFSIVIIREQKQKPACTSRETLLTVPGFLLKPVSCVKKLEILDLSNAQSRREENGVSLSKNWI